MAHEISVRSDDTAEAMFAGTPAWHGLGALVPSHVTPLLALTLAHLDWEVEKRPIRTETGLPITTHKATHRCDTGALLGVVGTDYEPMQNSQQAAWIESLVGQGSTVECCGALREGRRTFWTLKIPGDVMVSAQDAVKQYLIVANGHDGGLAFRAFWSPIRVVCSNTLNASLPGAKDGVFLRHTKGIHSSVAEAQRVLRIAGDYYNKLGETFRAMLATPMTDEGFTSYLDGLLPLSPTRALPVREEYRATVRNNWVQGAGAEMARGTVWGAYNAVTELTSHGQRTRGGLPAERRFMSVMFGAGKQLGQEAFEAAVELVN